VSRHPCPSARPAFRPAPPPSKLGEGSAAVARNEQKGGRGRGPPRRAPSVVCLVLVRYPSVTAVALRADPSPPAPLPQTARERGEHTASPGIRAHRSARHSARTPPPKLGEGSAGVARNEQKGGRGRGPPAARADLRSAPPPSGTPHPEHTARPGIRARRSARHCAPHPSPEVGGAVGRRCEERATRPRGRGPPRRAPSFVPPRPRRHPGPATKPTEAPPAGVRYSLFPIPYSLPCCAGRSPGPLCRLHRAPAKTTWSG
jgi:hypothetical protein